ncbi:MULTISPECIES: alpha-keto acid decarboxylase family protein [Mycolicibacterium]|uniref:Alpha-keto-acid decarboxylase n=1 Tax=Mycolicibacterium senegalense TaxID=1796 RepID=A0A378SYD1_9MYCO|nr:MULTISPECIES: thiamine pyrophosphate-dependent enzyme [Mycolicibacterium]MCV7334012.1 alpha-keto acid decarboxylase family protein [Mycolicibacterium senegalense]MDR7292349.1 indolepyruvate decarboxylase [Mycolicibacterium senegalense]QZA23729.1 alpha-keto acid decarboxylase family protein [Mycolicibacterium senegalense]CDP88433.1 indole-3-pyruvate decarboxylase [Mycolicibacterium farcinogenes]STZ52329.1 alpha-keto-acid decarboxylase [Mycolicibacterium senegalense]
MAENLYTVGDYLLDRLAELGVTEVFGVPGDYQLEFLDHILAHPTLRWVGGANELNAGYAADGYGRLRGMAALVTTFGVGELNALLAADTVGHATLMWGKSLVDESSPNYLGIYAGAASEDSVREAIEEAPVLVTAGVLFTDMVSGFFSQRIDPARTIDIGANQSTVAGQVYAPLDMAAALDAVTAILTERGITSPALPPLPARISADPPAPDVALTQEALWDRLSEALTPGNVVLADQGTSFYGMAGHRLASGVTFIGQPLWGSIGYTLPAALGAGLADRDRRTVLLIGDGAAQLTIQELGTFGREGLSPVVVVVNNDGYTVERAIHGVTAEYNDITGWRWTELPAALGVPDALAFRVSTYGELDDALTRAAATPDRMVFIEVMLGRMDIPPLLTELAQSASDANSS